MDGAKLHDESNSTVEFRETLLGIVWLGPCSQSIQFPGGLTQAQSK